MTTVHTRRAGATAAPGTRSPAQVLAARLKQIEKNAAEGSVGVTFKRALLGNMPIDRAIARLERGETVKAQLTTFKVINDGKRPPSIYTVKVRLPGVGTEKFSSVNELEKWLNAHSKP